jgi:hypothetical protein
MTETARAKSKRTVEEGERRRTAIETVIQDLVARRDEVIADIDRLAGDLRDATATYRNAPFGDEDKDGKGKSTRPGQRASRTADGAEQATV